MEIIQLFITFIISYYFNTTEAKLTGSRQCDLLRWGASLLEQGKILFYAKEPHRTLYEFYYHRQNIVKSNLDIIR